MDQFIFSSFTTIRINENRNYYVPRKILSPPLNPEKVNSFVSISVPLTLIIIPIIFVLSQPDLRNVYTNSI
jgi:hypothetical protein